MYKCIYYHNIKSMKEYARATAMGQPPIFDNGYQKKKMVAGYVSHGSDTSATASTRQPRILYGHGYETSVKGIRDRSLANFFIYISLKWFLQG